MNHCARESKELLSRYLGGANSGGAVTHHASAKDRLGRLSLTRSRGLGWSSLRIGNTLRGSVFDPPLGSKQSTCGRGRAIPARTPRYLLLHQTDLDATRLDYQTEGFWELFLRQQCTWRQPRVRSPVTPYNCSLMDWLCGARFRDY